jgi:arylamine N-acetyltransferase
LNNTYPILNEALALQVLSHLGVDAAPPSLSALDALLDAYVRRVLWESASRIARRADTSKTEDCSRWPETFWHEAMTLGTGGTCYESSYAFFALLRYLGYDGYLTINNMREFIGCHAAIVIKLDGERYLVDVGLPVHLPVLIDPSRTTSRKTDFHTYSAIPGENDTFLIERDNHPRSDCYLLVDRVVNDGDYRAILTNDYDHQDGQFLDRVILVRVIDGCIWRFNSDEGPPYHLEKFGDNAKTYYDLGDDMLLIAERVANRFEIDLNVMKKVIKAIPEK